MKYSDEQIDSARETDLIDFLESRGLTFKKSGNYYKCREHDSLVIKSDRKSFFWNSRNICGIGAVSWLRKVEGMDFPSAIKVLVGSPEQKSEQKYKTAPKNTKEERSELKLPTKTNGRYSRVYAYLSKTRGIDTAVINDFVRSGQIFQDERGNCVFVGFDEAGKARFGCIRGTITEMKYRGDCPGSDKEYSFAQIGKQRDRVYVFESPIDLLSHCTMANIMTHDSQAYKLQTRLSLSGVNDRALSAFLKRHPEVKSISLRLDNDDAGRNAVAELTKKYERQGYVVSAVFSKEKDVNADLVAKVSRNQNDEPPLTEKEKSFSQQVDEVLGQNRERYTGDLKVCDTPQILLDVGCRQLPILYTRKHLHDAVKPKNKRTHTHGLTVEQVKKTPDFLRNPAMIYDSLSRKDSIVVCSDEVDRDGLPIVISIRPNGKGSYNLEELDSNFVTSMYGKNNFENHIKKVINHNCLLYINKEKAKNLFSVVGLRTSDGFNSVLDLDNIIRQSRNIVNTFDEKFLPNEKGTKEMEQPQEKPPEKRNPWSIKTMSANAKKISESYEQSKSIKTKEHKKSENEL